MGIVTYDEYGQRRWNGRTYEEIIAAVKQSDPAAQQPPGDDAAKSRFEEQLRAVSLFLARFRADSDELEAVHYLLYELMGGRMLPSIRVARAALGIGLKDAVEMCDSPGRPRT